MYDNNNPFAKIIRHEIEARTIYEDDKILAFDDIHPAAPTHVIVIPKGEYIDYSDFINKASAEDISYYFTKIHDIAMDLGLDKSGFRLCMNRGSDSGKSVFHFHTHILSGTKFTNLVG